MKPKTNPSPKKSGPIHLYKVKTRVFAEKPLEMAGKRQRLVNRFENGYQVTFIALPSPLFQPHFFIAERTFKSISSEV
jgi:hypothetical protein